MRLSYGFLVLFFFSGALWAGDTVYVGGERHTLTTQDFGNPTPDSKGLTRYLANLNVVGDQGRELIFDIDVRVSGNGVLNPDFGFYYYKVSLLAGCNGTYIGIDDSEGYLMEDTGVMKVFINKRATFAQPCEKLTLLAVSWMENSELELNVAITEAF